MSVVVIAEAGVNHNGEPDLAYQLIDAAAEAGADFVKFQTFKAGSLVTRSAVKAAYQQKTTNSNENQYMMLKKLELSQDFHHDLVKYCDIKNIRFLSTAFDHESLAFLNNELNLNVLKISSGDITNGPLILAHAHTDKDIILSTGMSTLGEIEDALGVLAYGFLGDKTEPSREAFRRAYFSDSGRYLLKEKVTLLHCTTEYPAPPEDINLKVMGTLSRAFGLNVGYSDHSKGIAIPVAAAALGACVIEKHFTLDRNMQGPDHKASLEPDELASMIQSIRIIEKALGNSIKTPMPSELGNLSVARKSLVAIEDIKKGDIFTAGNLGIKRPGTGISPMAYWDVINTVSEAEYSVDQVLK